MSLPLVVHVITSTGIGGAERALERLLLDLKDRYRFEVLSIKPIGAIGERLQAAGVPVRSLSGSSRVYPGAAIRLYRELQTLKPDLVHAWLFQANFLSRFVSRWMEVPTISSIRTVEQEKIWQLWLDRSTSSLVDQYLAVCEAARQHHVNHGVPAEKIEVIPNGLVDEDFEPNQDADGFRNRHGVPANAFLLVSAGRLRWEKGHTYSLQALEQLRKEETEGSHPVWLLLAGQGSEEGALREEADRRGIADRVVFSGLLEGLRSAWEASNVHLLPSLWEGMPNVVLESAALGLPTVAYATGGTPEVIRDGETGFLCEAQDVPQLVARIRELWLDERKRKRMGEAAREWMRAEFRHDQTAAQTANIYDQLIRKNA